jgi:hypothetical protein
VLAAVDDELRPGDEARLTGEEPHDRRRRVADLDVLGEQLLVAELLWQRVDAALRRGGGRAVAAPLAGSTLLL